MPYDPSKNPWTDTISSSTQGSKKLLLTPGPNDIAPLYPKAVAVHSTTGDRVQISYVPTKNADDEPVTISVPDGWISDTSVRRVLSVTGGAAYGVW